MWDGWGLNWAVWGLALPTRVSANTNDDAQFFTIQLQSSDRKGFHIIATTTFILVGQEIQKDDIYYPNGWNARIFIFFVLKY